MALMQCSSSAVVQNIGRVYGKLVPPNKIKIIGACFSWLLAAACRKGTPHPTPTKGYKTVLVPPARCPKPEPEIHFVLGITTVL